MSQKRPAAGGESCKQDSFLIYGSVDKSCAMCIMEGWEIVQYA